MKVDTITKDYVKDASVFMDILITTIFMIDSITVDKDMFYLLYAIYV